MTLAECASYCSADDSCTAITWTETDINGFFVGICRYYDQPRSAALGTPYPNSGGASYSRCALPPGLLQQTSGEETYDLPAVTEAVPGILFFFFHNACP